MSGKAEEWIIVIRDASTAAIKVALGTTARTVTYNHMDETNAVVSESLSVEEGDYERFRFSFKPGNDEDYLPLEATLEIADDRVNVRDILEFASINFATGETAGEYYTRWSGRIRTGANTYNPDQQTYVVEAEGLYRELDSTVNDNTEYTEGSDVGQLILNIANSWHSGAGSVPIVPPGILKINASIGIVTTGKAAAGYAHLWRPDDTKTPLAALRSIASSNGTRTVLGVNPQRRVYFDVETKVTYTLTEGDDGVRIEWIPPQGQDVVTGVRWVLGRGNLGSGLWDATDTVSLETPDVITHLSDSGVTTYGERIISRNPDNVERAFRLLTPDDQWWPSITDIREVTNPSGNTESGSPIVKSGAQANGLYDSQNNPFTVDALPYDVPAGAFILFQDSIGPAGGGNPNFFYVTDDAPSGQTYLLGRSWGPTTATDNQVGLRYDYAFDGNRNSMVHIESNEPLVWTWDDPGITSDGADYGQVRLILAQTTPTDVNGGDVTDSWIAMQAFTGTGGGSQLQNFVVWHGETTASGPFAGTPSLMPGFPSIKEQIVIGDRAAAALPGAGYVAGSIRVPYHRSSDGGAASDQTMGIIEGGIYTIDKAALDAAAEDLYRIPEPGSVQATTYGLELSLANHLSVIKDGDVTAQAPFSEVPITETTVEVSVRDGVRVAYRTGDRFGSRASRESALIQARDGQAALSGARARFGDVG